MDKLKAKVLVMALIALVFISIATVSAADELASANQEDVNLSEETSINAPQNIGSSSANIDNDKLESGDTSVVDFEFHYYTMNGPQVYHYPRTASSGVSGSVGMAKFNNIVANSLHFDYENNHYDFSHWIDEDGNTVTTSQPYKYTGEDYSKVYTAVYDITPLGSLTVNYIDNIAHGSGGMSYTEYGTDYKHTFREPADIPSGAVFLYWENENGTIYAPGDSMSIKYSEFSGISKEINVYAVYDIKTEVSLEEITGYVGDKVNITAKITEKLNGAPLNGGTATLTIEGGSTFSAGVVDGEAVFKDITLGTPGTHNYIVEYSGFSYNKHTEGINDYLSSSEKSLINILPLNTTTSASDVSGSAGDKVDIVAEIVDHNGNPVMNGTAVLKINGKEYRAEVKNGKAIFKNVELPSKSTQVTIEYLGNDYYNPSNATIQVTINADNKTDIKDNDTNEPHKNNEDVSQNKSSTSFTQETLSTSKSTGNPIALVALALFALVSAVSLRRRK